MSDNLRTRIAAALYARAIERLGWNRSWDNLGAPSQQLWLDDADAVIRELGNLRQEPHRFQCGSDGCSRYRIISDWTTDE